MAVFGLLDRLTDPQLHSTFGYQGAFPGISPLATAGSALHYQFSINGMPSSVLALLHTQVTPSSMDLDGLTPIKYWDVRPH
jgi:hypothetical protein